MRKTYTLKSIVLLAVIIAFTIALVFISHWVNGIVIFEGLSTKINKQILYQSITLLGTMVFLFALWLTKKNTFKAYFRKGNLSADILPEPFMGIQPKESENWIHLGRNFSVIISSVTTIVIYFQLIGGNGISIQTMVSMLPFSIVFALSNSFVEESITRLGVVVVLKDAVKDRTIPFVSALLFGSVHYWGNPGGILGVLVAAFLGWFLTKSILETKGIFWAWWIHFLQDVIIITAVLSM